MGFDRDGEKYRIVVADTPAYKQFGNAVVVPVIEAIANLMTPYITATTKAQRMKPAAVQKSLFI